MNVILTTISKKASDLVSLGGRFLVALQETGWPDDRPDREEESLENDPVLTDILAHGGQIVVPATARIPESIRMNYDKWYSGCLGLVNANMAVRTSELVAANAEASKVLGQDYFTFESQLTLARNVRRINAIVASVPEYLDARLHDMELAIADAYVGDELNEASVLVQAGYVRCAGAMAGVLLERHLKIVCDHQQPPVRYGKRDGIAKLNDKLRDAQAYDQTQWRRIQWMADIRNACDHPGSSEPSKEDVTDMIASVRKFVALV